jgi:hypothetical protein
MKEMFDLGGAPAPADWVIDSGVEGPLWRYSGCGLDNVWVRGGLSFAQDYYVSFRNLRLVHGRIAAKILDEDRVSAPRFRLVRKLMGVSATSFAVAHRLDALELTAWEQGRGPQPAGVEEALRKAYALWRSGATVAA